MEKTQVISFIQSQLTEGTITRADLQALTGEEYRATQTSNLLSPPVPRSSRNLINVFYAIGGLIILSGVVILIAQHWTDIGFMGRVLVTLGISGVTYFAGVVMRSASQRVISEVFLTLSAALAPMGVYVILSENGISFDLKQQLIVAISLAFLFGVSWFITRRNILVLLIVGFMTWAYYAFLFEYLDLRLLGNDITLWATIVAGVSYILLGYGYGRIRQEPEATQEASSVRTILYGLGTLGLLGGGVALHGVWDLIYIPVLFAVFYASVFLRSRSMLVFAALFLIGHLIHLTYKYFVDSIGWPISLVIAGFIVIGIGYGTYHVSKKYIQSVSPA